MSDFKVGRIYEVQSKVSTTLDTWNPGDKLELFRKTDIGKKNKEFCYEFRCVKNPVLQMNTIYPECYFDSNIFTFKIGTKLKKKNFKNIKKFKEDLENNGLFLINWNKLPEHLIVEYSCFQTYNKKSFIEFENNYYSWNPEWFEEVEGEISENTENKNKEVCEMKPKFKVGDEIILVDNSSPWCCGDLKEKLGESFKVTKVEKLTHKQENSNFEYEVEMEDGKHEWGFESWFELKTQEKSEETKKEKEMKKVYAKMISVDCERDHGKYLNQIAEVLSEETSPFDYNVYIEVKFKDGYSTKFLKERFEILEDYNPEQHTFQKNEQVILTKDLESYKKGDVGVVTFVSKEKELLIVEMEEGIHIPVQMEEARKLTEKDLKKQESEKLEKEFQQQTELCKKELVQLFELQIYELNNRTRDYVEQNKDKFFVKYAELCQKIAFYTEPNLYRYNDNLFLDCLLNSMKRLEEVIEETKKQEEKYMENYKTKEINIKTLKSLLDKYSYLKTKYRK